MNTLNFLSIQEKESLLKYPAYISLLAAYSEDHLDKNGSNLAFKFLAFNSFVFNPLLAEFYSEAGKVFEKNIFQLDMDLPKEKLVRESAITKALSNLDNMVLKLGEDYASMMRVSMVSYKEHVLNADHNVVVDFVFPVPIKGITE